LTVLLLICWARAISRQLQWVMPSGALPSVAERTCWIFSAE